ncbi:MAG: hypothetical protein AAGA99_00620 [Actinomycetota bacterium]
MKFENVKSPEGEDLRPVNVRIEAPTKEHLAGALEMLDLLMAVPPVRDDADE